MLIIFFYLYKYTEFLWIETTVNQMVNPCTNFKIDILFLLLAEHALFMGNLSYKAKRLNLRSHEYGFNEVELFTCKRITNQQCF